MLVTGTCKCFGVSGSNVDASKSDGVCRGVMLVRFEVILKCVKK